MMLYVTLGAVLVAAAVATVWLAREGARQWQAELRRRRTRALMAKVNADFLRIQTAVGQSMMPALNAMGVEMGRLVAALNEKGRADG